MHWRNELRLEHFRSKHKLILQRPIRVGCWPSRIIAWIWRLSVRMPSHWQEIRCCHLWVNTGNTILMQRTLYLDSLLIFLFLFWIIKLSGLLPHILQYVSFIDHCYVNSFGWHGRNLRRTYSRRSTPRSFWLSIWSAGCAIGNLRLVPSPQPCFLNAIN